jgi:hypothetical protein
MNKEQKTIKDRYEEVRDQLREREASAYRYEDWDLMDECKAALAMLAELWEMRQ